MKRRIVTCVFYIVAATFLQANVSEQQLRAILYRSSRFIDDPEGPADEIRHAIRLVDDDTNRVVNLMKTLVEEGTNRTGFLRFCISEIGKYGTQQDLPFLYQCASDERFCRNATSAILKIDGLTTNSFGRIVALLPSGNYSWRSLEAHCLLMAAAEPLAEDSSVKRMAISNAVQNASHIISYVDAYDGAIVRLDPSYRMSKRRLSVLRAVQNLGVNEWQTNFVATAIRELESYPEADLPE